MTQKTSIAGYLKFPQETFANLFKDKKPSKIINYEKFITISKLNWKDNSACALDLFTKMDEHHPQDPLPSFDKGIDCVS